MMICALPAYAAPVDDLEAIRQRRELDASGVPVIETLVIPGTRQAVIWLDVSSQPALAAALERRRFGEEQSERDASFTRVFGSDGQLRRIVLNVLWHGPPPLPVRVVLDPSKQADVCALFRAGLTELLLVAWTGTIQTWPEHAGLGVILAIGPRDTEDRGGTLS